MKEKVRAVFVDTARPLPPCQTSPPTFHLPWPRGCGGQGLDQSSALETALVPSYLEGVRFYEITKLHARMCPRAVPK